MAPPSQRRIVSQASNEPASSSSSGESRSSLDTLPAKRRNLTSQACNRCRQLKVKCDGSLPDCRRCQRTHGDCQYDIGRSRMELLKRENRNLKNNLREERQGRGAAPTHPRDHDGRAMQPSNAIFLSGNLPFSSAFCANGYARPQQDQQVQNLTIPIHLIQPIESPDPEPMSGVYSTFRAFARDAIGSGTPRLQILGSPEIEAGRILDPSILTGPSMLDQWAFQVMASYVDQTGLAVRCGCVHMIFKLMRWQIDPTAENYQQIPAMMKPTASQLFVPHPGWIDYLLWPEMRELFISKPESYENDDWLAIAASTVHVDAFLTSTDICTFDKETERTLLKPSFLAYIDNPNHWVVSQQCGNAIPNLRGRISMD